MTIRTLALLLVVISSAYGQRKVDPKNTYNRVICVVPVVGAGTPADPKRPEYAPWPLPPPGTQTGIIAYSEQLSDNGKFALVEFVARNRGAFQALFNDKSITVFEKGRDPKANIESALRAFRKDFDLDKFGTVMP